MDLHRENPRVWILFERFALDRISLGHSHYSARTIFHRIRWETDAGADEPELKINDHYSPFYARRFERIHPGHEGFFRSRVQISERKPPTGRPVPLRMDFER